MHSRGFLHRDIKPDNFLMGLGRKANQVLVHVLSDWQNAWITCHVSAPFTYAEKIKYRFNVSPYSLHFYLLASTDLACKYFVVMLADIFSVLKFIVFSWWFGGFSFKQKIYIFRSVHWWQVYAIDFGLAKKYRDLQTHKHIPYR